MRTLKINFTDFWENFDKTDNFFYNLLSSKFSIEISDKPDFLFYSCYGKEYLKYDCIRIFFASENMRPDFLSCDYALTFDLLKKRNHFRLPLYHLYIIRHNYYEALVKRITEEEARLIWRSKKKFCCMVVSNSNSSERINFFQALSKVKKVDSGGRYLNNIGYSVNDKMAFIKDYKFVFAFENSSYPGYTTEKVLEPLIVNSIPIYWGNNLIEKEFNPKCFINSNDFTNYETLTSKIREIDENEDLAINMIMQNRIPDEAKDHLVIMGDALKFLIMIINTNIKKTVAKNSKFKIIIFLRAIKKKVLTRLHLMVKLIMDA